MAACAVPANRPIGSSANELHIGDMSVGSEFESANQTNQAANGGRPSVASIIASSGSRRWSGARWA